MVEIFIKTDNSKKRSPHLEDVHHGVESADEASSGKSPQSDCLVFAASHDKLVIGGDCTAPYLVLMTLRCESHAEIWVCTAPYLVLMTLRRKNHAERWDCTAPYLILATLKH